jgi:hypothetical protein
MARSGGEHGKGDRGREKLGDADMIAFSSGNFVDLEQLRMRLRQMNDAEMLRFGQKQMWAISLGNRS